MTASLLDHPLITGRYFFPRPDRFSDPFWVDCGDARLACAYFRTAAEALTVVHFHGNGEVVADYLGDFVDRVTETGCNLLLAEYRGYGMSTGRPELGKMLADVELLVKGAGVPEDKLVLFGRSVGSLFALRAARLFPGAAGLIIESGIADPLERLLLRVRPAELGVSAEEFAAEVNREMNHAEIMARFKGPSLIMHTRNDGLIDLSHGERLYDWAGGARTLQIFPRGDHNSIIQVNAQEYFDLVEMFLHEVVPGHHTLPL